MMLLLTACAQLHHVQIGEIHNHPGFVKKPFDIKISESGFSLEEAAGISKAVLNKRGGDTVGSIAAVVGLFQQGPRTGNPVYVNNYARGLVQVLYEKCPSGKITGLMSIRESRKYPVISGEIVKVTGYCLYPKKGNT